MTSNPETLPDLSSAPRVSKAAVTTKRLFSMWRQLNLLRKVHCSGKPTFRNGDGNTIGGQWSRYVLGKVEAPENTGTVLTHVVRHPVCRSQGPNFDAGPKHDKYQIQRIRGHDLWGPEFRSL